GAAQRGDQRYQPFQARSVRRRSGEDASLRRGDRSVGREPAWREGGRAWSVGLGVVGLALRPRRRGVVSPQDVHEGVDLVDRTAAYSSSVEDASEQKICNSPESDGPCWSMVWRNC
ncbi:hypothetical protein Q604_UNBC03323G0001, partial [human gut metagenome]